MADVEIKLDTAAVRELLRSKAVQDECVSHIKRVAEKCGPGYAVDTYVGKNRVNARIRPTTPAAVADNEKNDTLRKAVQSLGAD